MEKTYCSTCFRTGEELDAALTKALECDSNAVRAEQAAAAAEAALADATNKFAPAGFGLGTYAEKTLTTLAEIDAFKVCGFAKVDLTSEHIYGETYGTLECSASTRFIKQTLVFYLNGLAKLERIFYLYGNGNWEPWEWVNPPMTLGVEYRTTERYQGKPVYVKLVDCGALPISTQKTVDLGVATAIPIDFVGTTSYGSVLTGSGDNDHICTLQVRNSDINIKTTTDQSAYTLNVKVKYTKTTD